MPRLFTGLEIPPLVAQTLATMRGGLPGARWIDPENYHLTLRFLGEVPGHRAEELDLALATLRGKQFTLQLSGCGVHEKAGRSGPK